MNRIFRKVWNKALGQWVVASELATADKAGAQSASAIAAPRRHGLTVALGRPYTSRNLALETRAGSGSDRH
jgi:hypothetical protein